MNCYIQAGMQERHKYIGSFFGSLTALGRAQMFTAMKSIVRRALRKRSESNTETIVFYIANQKSI